MTVKFILFDADGVVIHPWRFRRYLMEHHQITPEMTHEFYTGVFNQCLDGAADLRDVLPAYLQAWNWPDSVDRFLQIWFEVEDAPDERLLARISDLRAAGYLCCLATSQESHRAGYMRAQMGFDSFFDRLYFSCDVGYHKPQPEFYENIQYSLGGDASQILFWDDSEGNVLAARTLGWQAEVYTGLEDFERKIEGWLGREG